MLLVCLCVLPAPVGAAVGPPSPCPCGPCAVTVPRRGTEVGPGQAEACSHSVLHNGHFVQHPDLICPLCCIPALCLNPLQLSPPQQCCMDRLSSAAGCWGKLFLLAQTYL